MDGLIIAEIQQNSDTTYRVYDWNRVGADGRPRPLPVEKALDVINFEQAEPEVPAPILIEENLGIRRSLLCQNQYFVTERIEMTPGSIFEGNCNGDSLEIWGVLTSAVQVADVHLDAIQFTLLPAAMGKFNIAADGKATLLCTYVEKVP